MANYEAKARSNYVHFSNLAAVQALCEAVDDVTMTQPNEDGALAILIESSLPREVVIDGREIDFPYEIASHVAPGEVIVFQKAGYEKQCYMAGYAIAINSEGESRSIGIDEIYTLAKELAPEGVTITQALY